MLIFATLTAVFSVFTIMATALPAIQQIYLGDDQLLPFWASDTTPPSLERNIHSATTTLPVRIDHPFIVPVDQTGRPTGIPSLPSELILPSDEGS